MSDVPESCNEVRLVGRISGDPADRELPSGDHVVSFRLVVPRGTPGKRPTLSGATHDTIDISCFTVTARRRALSFAAGDTAEVTGSLRRRFFRVGGSPQSRYDVEARTVRRVTRR